MHDGPRIGGRVDRQVHRELGRRGLRRVDFVTRQRHHADIGWPELGVRHAGRRDGHVIADAHAHVAGRAHGQPVSRQPPAVANELLTGNLQVRVGLHYNGMLDGRPTKK